MMNNNDASPVNASNEDDMKNIHPAYDVFIAYWEKNKVIERRKKLEERVDARMIKRMEKDERENTYGWAHPDFLAYLAEADKKEKEEIREREILRFGDKWYHEFIAKEKKERADRKQKEQRNLGLEM